MSATDAITTRLLIVDLGIYIALILANIFADNLLPESLFNPKLSYFRTRAWEENGEFYQRVFKIRRWKDLIPSFPGLIHFSKKHLNKESPEYLNRFIRETCRGELNHLRLIVFSLSFIFFNPIIAFLFIFIFTLIFNVPCIMIQRYNRPRLQHIFENRMKSGFNKI
jgi:glycosyl-4,4'-diaponeurosporenoate acyltransferase